MLDFDRVERLLKINQRKGSFINQCVGRGSSWWTDVKRGRSVASNEQIQKIAEALGTTFEYLTGSSNVPNKEMKESAPSAEAEEALEKAARLYDFIFDVGLIKEGQQLSGEDADFLITVIRLIDAWFNRTK